MELSVGDEAAGELEEGFVDVGSPFPTEAETPEAVQPGGWVGRAVRCSP
jgi:hypothetical protein